MFGDWLMEREQAAQLSNGSQLDFYALSVHACFI
jgi:hypothetical protein